MTLVEIVLRIQSSPGTNMVSQSRLLKQGAHVTDLDNLVAMNILRVTEYPEGPRYACRHIARYDFKPVTGFITKHQYSRKLDYIRNYQTTYERKIPKWRREASMGTENQVASIADASGR